MPSFSVCTAVAEPGLLRAAENWSVLGIEHLIFGECELPPSPQRRVFPEIRLTSDDQASLADLLGCAALHASHPWILLFEHPALLTPDFVRSIDELCRPERLSLLALGRAWRLPDPALDNPLLPLDEQLLHGAMATAGVLDHPGCPSWLLLPRGSFVHAPAALSWRPSACLAWLVAQARTLGWPILEASAAAPLLVPESTPCAPLLPGPAWRSCRDATGVVLPFNPGAPRLSFLLAAPEAELPELAEALKPAASLPWEVIARPDLGPDAGPGSTAAAWNSALAEARGDLVWPLSTQLPSLALVPTMLRCFDAPVVDLVHLPQSCAGRVISDASAARLQPGCLVAGRGWF